MLRCEREIWGFGGKWRWAHWGGHNSCTGLEHERRMHFMQVLHAVQLSRWGFVLPNCRLAGEWWLTDLERTFWGQLSHGAFDLMSVWIRQHSAWMFHVSNKEVFIVELFASKISYLNIRRWNNQYLFLLSGKYGSHNYWQQVLPAFKQKVVYPLWFYSINACEIAIGRRKIAL